MPDKRTDDGPPADLRYTIKQAPDGDVTGCQVLDPWGEPLAHVETVEWIHHAGELPRIRITLFGKPADPPLAGHTERDWPESPATQWTCPNGHSLEFEGQLAEVDGEYRVFRCPVCAADGPRFYDPLTPVE